MTQLIPEMEEIVIRLHKAGYTVSLMSNTFDLHAKSNELNGFYSLFDNVFLSNEIGIRKPDVEKYKHVIKKLDTKPKNCIFVDDKLSNLVPARKMGFITLKFEGVDRFREQLSESGIEEISPGLRLKIKKKYKKYKMSKKEYKKAKHVYKSAKKEYLKKKSHSLSKKQEYNKKKAIYEKKRAIYEERKAKKDEKLISKIPFG